MSKWMTGYKWGNSYCVRIKVNWLIVIAQTVDWLHDIWPAWEGFRLVEYPCLLKNRFSWITPQGRTINDLEGAPGREFVLSFFFPRQLAVELFLQIMSSRWFFFFLLFFFYYFLLFFFYYFSACYNRLKQPMLCSLIELMQAWVRWIETHMKSIPMSKIDKYDVTSYWDVSILVVSKRNQLISADWNFSMCYVDWFGFKSKNQSN